MDKMKLMKETYFPNDIEYELDFKDQLEFNQLKLISEYFSLDIDERTRLINFIGTGLVIEYLNGDGTNLKVFLGMTGGEGYLSKEELENVERDFWLAIQKKRDKEFKWFFLLDLLPMSSRMADALVITADDKIELYDFTTGIIARKLEDYNGKLEDLPNKQQKQYLRKKRQAERIESFKGKVVNDYETTESLKMPSGEVSMMYYTSDDTFNIEVYIKEYIDDSNKYGIDNPIPKTFLFFPEPDIEYEHSTLYRLKGELDDPIYIHGDRLISPEIMDFIYENDTHIAFNNIYFMYFITRFTHFNIEYGNIQSFKKGMRQLEATNEKGETKGIFLRDTRTNCKMPLMPGFIYKHVYRNLDAYGIAKYLSYACNIKVKHKYENYREFCEGVIKEEHCDIWDWVNGDE